MDKRILFLQSHISSRLQSPPTIEELSAQINVSPSRLRQLFKNETGMPLSGYLRYLQMECACELLTTTFLQVSEIGLEIVFFDQSYFVRLFKERYNLTPTQYRDRNHKSYNLNNKNHDI